MPYIDQMSKIDSLEKSGDEILLKSLLNALNSKSESEKDDQQPESIQEFGISCSLCVNKNDEDNMQIDCFSDIKNDEESCTSTNVDGKLNVYLLLLIPNDALINLS